MMELTMMERQTPVRIFGKSYRAATKSGKIAPAGRFRSAYFRRPEPGENIET